MTYPQIFLGIIILASICTGLLFVLFGQVTVRSLRKKARGTNQLGIEIMSGWDILNVAGALSTPKWLRDKFLSSRLSGITTNYAYLYNNTNKLDRVLARVFWFFYLVTGFLIILYTLASILGFFD